MPADEISRTSDITRPVKLAGKGKKVADQKNCDQTKTKHGATDERRKGSQIGCADVQEFLRIRVR